MKRFKIQDLRFEIKKVAFWLLPFTFCLVCFSQTIQKSNVIDVTNKFGKVWIIAEEIDKFSVEPTNEVEISANNIVVKPKNQKARIDIVVKVPLRSFVRVQTDAGEVKIGGNVANAEVKTDTGTIFTEIPLDDVTYSLLWTASRPRFLSDFKLEDVKEKNAGKFEIKGKFQGKSDEGKEISEGEETKDKGQKTKNISLNLTTARGIVLLNIKPSEVSSDLRERPLTEASKAIVRSGDSMLMDAIRKSSPKYFGDFAKTLPPLKREPNLNDAKPNTNLANSEYKRVTVKVVDEKNRAVSNLTAKDFVISESGKPREVLEIQNSTSSFNIVLLLDVSGSVENYVDFIRKTARQFVNTMDKNDKISIVTFRDDVKVISKFTVDKKVLSESLDTFDAGGGTAYFDAVAYSLVETLRPLRGERTAIIAITDGDDNRSFLPFDALLGSIEESGALIYPLYVPSELIASNATVSQDSLRTKYLGLTSKAQGEGEKLAKISGGVYYQIKRLEDLQKAYDDIVVQLRTAYNVTFRSETAELGSRSTPRLKVKVNRENVFTSLGAISELSQEESKKFEPIEKPKETSKIVEEFAENEIRGEVEKVNYKQFVNDKLREVKIDKLNINNSPSSFILTDRENKIAVSRWLSPKRSRSYPYQRVYETLGFDGKKVAIIPVIKDEGLGGERDFLQWDTISLLSLLDVHVVLAYYDDAVKNTKQNDQITSQKLDNEFVLSKLREVSNYKGTSREWNENEAKNLKNIFTTAKESYAKISEKTKTYLHNSDAIDELISFAETPNKFIEFSRQKSSKAQDREFNTLQPKEALDSDTKARVTITNALFGKYFFTCDETKVEEKVVWLIEAKHSQRSILPSENDIKDGLLKMMIYTNLRNVKIGRGDFESKPALKLTSTKIVGNIKSDATEAEVANFFKANLFDVKMKVFLTKLLMEARENKFTIILESAEATKK
jgi:VWFA-related protein